MPFFLPELWHGESHACAAHARPSITDAMASPREGASPAGLPRVETLQTWDAWLTLSGSPRTEADAPARCDPAVSRAGGDRLLDAVLVAPGLPRSMTVAHLQSAAGLLRDGYGTSEEQCRLELLCAAAATELPEPASLPRSIASGEVDDDDTDSGGDDGGSPRLRSAGSVADRAAKGDSTSL